MFRTGLLRRGAASLAVAITIGAFAVAAAPNASAAERHCAVRVVGQRANGELVVSAAQCRGDRAMAVRAVQASSPIGTPSFTIGTHYDGINQTGSSFSVVGSNCSGGWLNVTASWDNRISSTANGCPRIRHYDGANLTGSSATTFAPGGNLGLMDNRTTSIQYLT